LNPPLGRGISCQPVAETAKCATGKIAAIHALPEHTTEHMRIHLPKR